MKCPKCQYISFDSAGRCRNCGYDFSLSDESAEPAEASELRIQNDDEPVGPYGDFSLNPTPNLPLFTRDGDPDAPLVTPAAVPRAPLAVRRTAPAAPRPRQKREPSPPEPRLALDTADLTGVYAPADAVPDPVPEIDARVDAPAEPIDHTPHAALAPAGRISRLAGAMIDLLLIGGIDLAVVYFTLKICELTFADVFVLPVAPLVTFLLLLNGGYISTFVAASGQTIGKMAAGTRVIPADPSASATERVPLGQSIVRAAGYFVSALPLGLGFVPAFVGRDRRALHDRLADTRVVKA
jgi:uncharacterized RDD family membrane protein YckC